jgi:L-aminopeptidase/D-esterase-like protein
VEVSAAAGATMARAIARAVFAATPAAGDRVPAWSDLPV